MSDPDVPRMRPDLPQFAGITPTDSLAAGAGEEGPSSTRKRIVLAWGLWDWGSAAFNAVVTTFVFTVYLTSSSFGPEGTVEAQLGWALAAAGLLIAVLAPVTGQRSDTSGRRKFWLAVNTYIVVALTAAMFFVQPDPAFLLLGLILVAAGNVFFEFAGVNYNAMLSQVSTARSIGRVSGFGWGMGYIGGIVLLLIVYFGFVQGLFGVPDEDGLPIRVAMIVSAVWFGLFALPVLFAVPEYRGTGATRARVSFSRVVPAPRPRHRKALARVASHRVVPAGQRRLPRRAGGRVHVRRRARGIRLRLLAGRGHHLRDRSERRGRNLDHGGRRAR